MPGFLSRLRSTLSRNRAGERPLPFPSWTERSRLVDHDTGLGPRSGMFAVVWLNGVQVLIVFLKKLPYSSRRRHGDQPPRPRNLCEFVRPMPQDNPFDMKAGRKFTLFLGQNHFLVELVEILSKSENPLQPLPQDSEYRRHADAMQSEPIGQNDSSLHTPYLVTTFPPPNSGRTINSPTTPMQDVEPDDLKRNTPTKFELDHHRKRSKRDYNKDLPSWPRPLPVSEIPSFPFQGPSRTLRSGKQAERRNDDPIPMRSESSDFPEIPTSDSESAISTGKSTAVAQRTPTIKQPRERSMSRTSLPPQKMERGFLHVMNPDDRITSTTETSTRVGGLGNSGGSVPSYYQPSRLSNSTSSRGTSRHLNDD